MAEVFRQEREPCPTYGLALFIIHSSTGAIRTFEEQKDKPRTLRKKGQRSIPIETMKSGERPIDNLRGAVAEAFDDFDRQGNDIRQYLSQHLFTPGNPESAIVNGFGIQVGDGIIRCNYGVLIYDGNGIDVNPFHHEEAAKPMWMMPNMLLAYPDVRPFARLATVDFLGKGHYDQALNQFHSSPDQAQRIFDENFSIRQFFAAREQLTDNG